MAKSHGFANDPFKQELMETVVATTTQIVHQLITQLIAERMYYEPGMQRHNELTDVMNHSLARLQRVTDAVKGYRHG